MERIKLWKRGNFTKVSCQRNVLESHFGGMPEKPQELRAAESVGKALRLDRGSLRNVPLRCERHRSNKDNKQS